ncbi:hypothetical protein ACLOJK_002707 [Asimina triloba]
MKLQIIGLASNLGVTSSPNNHNQLNVAFANAVAFMCCELEAYSLLFVVVEVFHRLPLPYIDEEFRTDLMLKDDAQDEMKPAPYVHIRRSIPCI